MKNNRAFTLTELVASFVLILMLFGFTQAIIGCGGGGSGNGQAGEDIRKTAAELKTLAGDLKTAADDLKAVSDTLSPIASKVREEQDRYGPPKSSSKSSSKSSAKNDLDSKDPSIRRNARQMQATTQVRGIIQGLINFAPGNNEWYPGLTGKGKEDQTPITASDTAYGTKAKGGYDPAFRYAVMIRNSYFTPDYAVNPAETDAKIVAATLDKSKGNPGDVSVKNYSFAMLELASEKGRNKEWMSTTNSKAAVVTDRNIGADAQAGAKSIYSDESTPWRGVVGYNDCHVNFETTHIFDNLSYAGNSSVLKDNLFQSGDALEGTARDSEPDALMTYNGPSDGGVNQKP